MSDKNMCRSIDADVCRDQDLEWTPVDTSGDIASRVSGHQSPVTSHYHLNKQQYKQINKKYTLTQKT